MKIPHHPAGRVPQPTADPMALDGRAHRLRDDQTHVRSAAAVTMATPSNMNDEIGLRHTHPVLHRHIKLR